ncbi:MAG: hypothetical protein WBE34_20810 [Candidatus Nitrosopolaris sp.]
MIINSATLVSIAVVLLFAGVVMMISTIQQPAKAINGPVPNQNATVQNSTANSSAASSIVTQPQTK